MPVVAHDMTEGCNFSLKGHIYYFEKRAQIKIKGAIKNQTQTNQCRHKEFQMSQSLTNIDIKQDVALVFSRLKSVGAPVAPILHSWF